MSLRRLFQRNRNVKADGSSLQNDRSPTFTSNVTTPSAHSLPGLDFVKPSDETDSSITNTLDVAETSEVAAPNYIYYRIYAEDGAIPSKTPVTPRDPFLGRIKVGSVPPPRTAKALKRSIAKVEDIKDRTSTSLFLALYSQSPVNDAEKVTSILNGTSPGSTPQKPLALVAQMSDSERSALESGGRSAAEPDKTTAEIRYLYYRLYADDYEIPSKVAIDPEEPSIGRIRADFVAPPHSPISIKRCISRVERNPALAWHADLFADTSCDTPLKEGHISILRTDGPGRSPNDPMAIVQVERAVESTSISHGRYVIKNRAADIYWNAWDKSNKTVYFSAVPMEVAKNSSNTHFKWDIKHDTNGSISMSSPCTPSSWVGAEITGSAVPVPWRLIPADRNFYYLTTDMNHASRNPRVPAAQSLEDWKKAPGLMATLKEGDQWQMWEFVRV